MVAERRDCSTRAISPIVVPRDNEAMRRFMRPSAETSRTLTLPLASNHIRSPSSPSRQMVSPAANSRRVKSSPSRSSSSMVSPDRKSMSPKSSTSAWSRRSACNSSDRSSIHSSAASRSSGTLAAAAAPVGKRPFTIA